MDAVSNLEVLATELIHERQKCERLENELCQKYKEVAAGLDFERRRRETFEQASKEKFQAFETLVAQITDQVGLAGNNERTLQSHPNQNAIVVQPPLGLTIGHKHGIRTSGPPPPTLKGSQNQSGLVSPQLQTAAALFARCPPRPVGSSQASSQQLHALDAAATSNSESVMNDTNTPAMTMIVVNNSAEVTAEMESYENANVPELVPDVHPHTQGPNSSTDRRSSLATSMGYPVEMWDVPDSTKTQSRASSELGATQSMQSRPEEIPKHLQRAGISCVLPTSVVRQPTPSLRTVAQSVSSNLSCHGSVCSSHVQSRSGLGAAAARYVITSDGTKMSVKAGPPPICRQSITTCARRPIRSLSPNRTVSIPPVIAIHGQPLRSVSPGRSVSQTRFIAIPNQPLLRARQQTRSTSPTFMPATPPRLAVGSVCHAEADTTTFSQEHKAMQLPARSSDRRISHATSMGYPVEVWNHATEADVGAVHQVPTSSLQVQAALDHDQHASRMSGPHEVRASSPPSRAGVRKPQRGIFAFCNALQDAQGALQTEIKQGEAPLHRHITQRYVSPAINCTAGMASPAINPPCYASSASSGFGAEFVSLEERENAANNRASSGTTTDNPMGTLSTAEKFSESHGGDPTNDGQSLIISTSQKRASVSSQMGYPVECWDTGPGSADELPQAWGNPISYGAAPKIGDHSADGCPMDSWSQSLGTASFATEDFERHSESNANATTVMKTENVAAFGGTKLDHMSEGWVESPYSNEEPLFSRRVLLNNGSPNPAFGELAFEKGRDGQSETGIPHFMSPVTEDACLVESEGLRSELTLPSQEGMGRRRSLSTQMGYPVESWYEQELSPRTADCLLSA